ncbi:uncharacterized protein C106.07c-like [Andrographis paniculata]|uniref:uncharacterized protein C106.07c-like n=1 Tax=Andrographis paniculata TaxID=175694 RepID=UPI0021E87314|nr:uncharacterized protein C106.07c-like [Andrographis paniculata]
MAAARIKQLLKKYGKVGLGVHLSVSAASISGLYVAIKSNIDVETMLEKVGLPSLSKESHDHDSASDPPVKNRTTELVASSGGALALAVLINKALFPVRVPITLAVTPPLARFLARRNLIKQSNF